MSATPEENCSPHEIHRVLSTEDVHVLKEIFHQKNDALKAEELREALTVVGLQYGDEDFDTLFLKINTNHDEYCQWDELVDYLILGFQNDDPLAVKQSLKLPLADKPIVKLGHQIYIFTKIEFCPMVAFDGTVNWSIGKWITTTREGFITFWKKDWNSGHTVKSNNIDLKQAKTWIMDASVLPDQKLFVVACLECEMRFYDINVSGFILKTIVGMIPQPINKLYYHFGKGIGSKLVLGDYVGSVGIIEFSADQPEPRFDGAAKVQRLTWSELGQGGDPAMVYHSYGRLLPDIVRCLFYVESMECLMAASEENPLETDMLRSSPNRNLVIQNFRNKDERIEFGIPRGVSHFAYDEPSEMLVTGGPDCDIRLWDIKHPEKPKAVLVGHTACVTYLFLQDGDKIYSMDEKNMVRVWDVPNRTLMQTYNQFGMTLGKSGPAIAYYNDLAREMIVARNKLLVAPCSPMIPLQITDGESHMKAVSVLLYNSLFKLVVSCGLDSCIIVWDHLINRKMTIITEAHTQLMNGIDENVEITTGCFDRKQQLLLTGASDGSLKIWNFNNGSCLRTMSIGQDWEVTSVFWQTNSILAMGWNHQIMEFPKGGMDEEHSKGIGWRVLHLDDILCAAMTSMHPSALATCSYSGEIIFWKTETGQPYRRYDASNPRTNIPIRYFQDGVSRARPRKSIRQSIFAPQAVLRQRRLSRIALPTSAARLRSLSIHTLLFLDTRPMLPSYGTLLASLDNGMVQVWSHHPDGGLVDAFNAIHMAGDRIIAMTTDAQNRFLFTGTALGYVKTWLIEDYCVPEENKIKICKPKLRLQFPFLLQDVILGRAKRSVTMQPKPWLLNSYQAHRKCITGLVYLDDIEVLISSSSDHTIRIWSLAGRYIGLLGSPIQWLPLSSECPPPATYGFRVPPDLQREVSFTTLKVLSGGASAMQLKEKTLRTTSDRKIVAPVQTYGAPLREPLIRTDIMILPERAAPVSPKGPSTATGHERRRKDQQYKDFLRTIRQKYGR